MGNCHRYLEAYCAIPGIGAVIVPLNTRDSAPEHRAILDDCTARVLLADDRNAARASALAADDLDVVLAPQDYERALETGPAVALDGAVDDGDLAAICYTGGTTGRAKGVLLTHRNLVANAFHITIAFGYSERDTYLHAAPMFHLADGSSIYALIWRGARHVFLPTFDPGQVLGLVQRERVSFTIGVPAMLGAHVQHPLLKSTDLQSLRLIAHGGAPISAALLKRAVAMLGCSFTQAYGLTESSSLASALANEETLLDDRRLRSVGRAVMGVKLVVRRADGSPCEPGEVGEVTGRGPNFTSGYWERPEETSAVLRDGWFWTGDLGSVDADGYVYLVDRAKDMIISGGENVYSAEVEAVLGAHPSVAESAVIGIPDATWGERVHALIVIRPGHTLEPQVLRDFCREQLAGYKSPRSFELIPALPRSGAGKVLKRELRAPYWVGLESQVH
jgi:long-chain acyl-CoA synthetase